MQVFNSFQEMAVGTGALGACGSMSVFNMCMSAAVDEIDEMATTLDNLFHMDDEFISDLPDDDPRVDKMYEDAKKAMVHLSSVSKTLDTLADEEFYSYGDDDMW